MTTESLTNHQPLTDLFRQALKGILFLSMHQVFWWLTIFFFERSHLKAARNDFYNGQSDINAVLFFITKNKTKQNTTKTKTKNKQTTNNKKIVVSHHRSNLFPFSRHFFPANIQLATLSADDYLRWRTFPWSKLNDFRKGWKRFVEAFFFIGSC